MNHEFETPRNTGHSLIKAYGFPLLLLFYSVAILFYPEQGDLILAGFALVGVALEKYIPYHTTWAGFKTDSKIDGLFSLVSLLTAVAVKTGLTILIARFAFMSTLWPSLPLAVSIPVALILSSLGPYLLHRAAHEWSGILWEIHAVHHAPERVYSLNALRVHPLNAGWNVLAGLLPLLILGADSTTILIAGALNNFFSIFNHMNIAFHNPMLSIFLNTADLHRWHHSNRKEFGDRNYSSGALTIWDLVFRSWRLPAGHFKSSEAGLYSGSNFPGWSISRQMFRPLCRCA